MDRLHIKVFGSVQGVFFRAGAQGEARRLGLFGWCRNLPDGSVEIVAEGERQALEELLSWSREGPAGSSVSDVKYRWLPATGEFGDFRIKY